MRAHDYLTPTLLKEGLEGCCWGPWPSKGQSRTGLAAWGPSQPSPGLSTCLFLASATNEGLAASFCAPTQCPGHSFSSQNLEVEFVFSYTWRRD